MLQKIKETAAGALRPVAKAVVTRVLSSALGDEIGTLRVVKRFARQWAASADLYDLPANAGYASPHTSPAAAPRPAAGPIEPRGEQRPVLVYVSNRHSSCKTARRILAEIGIAYSEIDLSDDPERRQKLYQETQDRTFPQIYIDGKRLGGFDDLVVAREEGRLRDLLYPPAREV